MEKYPLLTKRLSQPMLAKKKTKEFIGSRNTWQPKKLPLIPLRLLPPKKALIAQFKKP
jgi:hypothetical protein